MKLDIKSKLNYAEIAGQLNDNPTKYVLKERDRSGRGWICPICGSGSGKNGSGVTTDDGTHFTCWAGGCFTHEDAVGIIGKQNNLDPRIKADFAHIMEIGADIIGCAVGTDDIKRPTAEEWKQAGIKEPKKEDPTDYQQFLLQAEKNLPQAADYLQKRGISLETAKAFHCGYVSEWLHPSIEEKQKKGILKAIKPTPRLIIPVNSYKYLARDTRSNLSDAEKEHSKMRVGSTPGKCYLFALPQALKHSQHTIFIVEGEIDALSFYEVGLPAIGLGSIVNIDKGVELLKKEAASGYVFIPLLDNDSAGSKAQEKLIVRLKEAGLPYSIPTTLPPNGKDSNESLTSNAMAFSDWANKEATKALKTLSNNNDVIKPLEEEKEATEAIFTPVEDQGTKYTLRTATNAMPYFLQAVSQNRNTTAVSTGLNNLDNVLAGGFRPGQFIILGGLPAMGKTTAAIQLACNMAASGRQVLYVSLEMAEAELIAKGIAYYTHKNAVIEDPELQHIPLSYSSILDGRIFTIKNGCGIFNEYTNSQLHNLNVAMREYQNYASNLWIQAGTGSITVEDIIKTAKAIYLTTGFMPVVIVDYLQIIACSIGYERNTDKEKIDHITTSLKQLATGAALRYELNKESTELQTVVMAIVSFNRNSYGAGAQEDSGKGSGDLEYTADLQLAIEPTALKYAKDSKEGKEIVQEEKRKRVKEIDIKVTKLRREVQPKDQPAFKLYNGAYFEPVESTAEYSNYETSEDY